MLETSLRPSRTGSVVVRVAPSPAWGSLRHRPPMHRVDRAQCPAPTPPHPTPPAVPTPQEQQAACAQRHNLDQGHEGLRGHEQGVVRVGGPGVQAGPRLRRGPHGQARHPLRGHDRGRQVSGAALHPRGLTQRGPGNAGPRGQQVPSVTDNNAPNRFCNLLQPPA